MKKHILFFISLWITGIVLGQSALPFFRNFTSAEYKGHNRNFDIIGDDQGRIYVANFEGVLVYDHATWTMLHTTGISRIVCLYKDKDNKIWFGGYNVLGTIATNGYKLHLEYVLNDSVENSVGEIDQINSYNQSICFHTSTGKSYMLKNKQPVETRLPATVFSRLKEEFNVGLTLEDGLCSTHINQTYDDGFGGLWGATENGIFCISTSRVFSHYTEDQGIHGEVLSVCSFNNKLLVGTLEGLFIQNGHRFERVPQIDLACWQLLKDKGENILIASANGLFTYTDKGLRQLNDHHTLSVYEESDHSLITGEISHMCRQYPNGNFEILNTIQNVTNISKIGPNLFAQTINGECYLSSNGIEAFKKISNQKHSQLTSYTDLSGRTWKPEENGSGLSISGEDINPNLKTWLKAFSGMDITVIYEDHGITWVGGTFGVIGIDLEQASKSSPVLSIVRLRSVSQKRKDLSFAIATDQFNPIGKTLYSYRLNDQDNWSEWSENQVVNLYSQNPGTYDVQARAMDCYGNIVNSETFRFTIPYPIYLRWYFILFYLIALVFLIAQFFLYRQRKLVRDKNKLQSEVDKRTGELQTALSDLKEMQKELLFKEREATTGKLMKGLVDRILNPMNYINNFSHLTLGLAKDLGEDLEDEKDNLTEDNYEDCKDIIDMMHTNISKIEEHGLSTTRILKAMEEMLNAHATTHTPVALNEIIENCEDITRNKYFTKEIQQEGIEFCSQITEKPVVIMGIPEWLTRTVMSMITNSIYAIQKKKAQYSGYKPILKLSLEENDNYGIVRIYDNGIGIESTILDKIKDPFFTTKPTSEASGLGLFFCQRALDEFNGTFDIHSTKNEFTECILQFPRAKESENNQVKKETL